MTGLTNREVVVKVISWNLLRLTGAAVEDVARLLEREKPDVLLMQEVTEHIDLLPTLVHGHFHRQPWPGRIHGLAVWTRHHHVAPYALPLPASRLPGRLPRSGRNARHNRLGDTVLLAVRQPHPGCPAACRAAVRRSSRWATSPSPTSISRTANFSTAASSRALQRHCMESRRRLSGTTTPSVPF